MGSRRDEMDFTPLIAALLAQLWYVIPLLLLMTIVKTPWFKGMVGEWLITLSIRLFLDKREYHLLNNVTLPLEQGTTQIDHVIVSRFGEVLIERNDIKWSEQQYSSLLYFDIVDSRQENLTVHLAQHQQCQFKYTTTLALKHISGKTLTEIFRLMQWRYYDYI